MSDVVVIVSNVGHGVEVCGREVADIQINPEVLRHSERFGKTFRSGEFIGVLYIGMAVHRHVYLVSLRERNQPLGDAELSGRGNNAYTERFGLFERFFQFVIRKAPLTIESIFPASAAYKGNPAKEVFTKSRLVMVIRRSLHIRTAASTRTEADAWTTPAQ